MAGNERPDILTRFKKGQSGNPRGRPKGTKNKAAQLKDVLFREIVVKDGQGSRSVPKILAAAEVCLNNALKGDLRSFVKIMEIVHKFQLIENSPNIPEEISEIRITYVDPQVSETPMEQKEYLARLAPTSDPTGQ
jgi:Family of unknown function (DUF5681)